MKCSLWIILFLLLQGMSVRSSADVGEEWSDPVLKIKFQYIGRMSRYLGYRACKENGSFWEMVNLKSLGNGVAERMFADKDFKMNLFVTDIDSPDMKMLWVSNARDSFVGGFHTEYFFVYQRPDKNIRADFTQDGHTLSLPIICYYHPF